MFRTIIGKDSDVLVFAFRKIIGKDRELAIVSLFGAHGSLGTITNEKASDRDSRFSRKKGSMWTLGIQKNSFAVGNIVAVRLSAALQRESHEIDA